MRPGLVRTAAYFSTGAGKAIAACGAACALYGVALPWSQTRLFGALPLAVPGYCYVLGGLALAGAIFSILLLRFPLVMIACGIVVSIAAGEARIQVPHVVRGQLLGAQIAFAPLNRLLDQFHIANVTVGDYGAKDDALLGPGIDMAFFGGLLILAGGLAALPGDPLLRAARLRFGRQRCRSCHATWPLRRQARHCPVCGVFTESGKGCCSRCAEPTQPEDQFCVRCGTGLAIHRNS